MLKLHPIMKFACLGTALPLLLSSCFKGPGFMKQDGDAAEAVYLVKAADQGDGITVGSITGTSTSTQKLTSQDGSAVSFPPGSLSVDTMVTVQPGSDIASGVAASALGISSLNTASAAVVVSSSANIDANAPFTLQIPLGSGTNLYLDDPYAKLVILYKVTQVSNGRIALGVIPRSALSIADGKVNFQTKYFGSFQAAYSQDLVTDAKETTASTPILSKAEAKKLTPAVWGATEGHCDSPSPTAAKKCGASSSVTGLQAPLACTLIFDNDKAFPWLMQLDAGGQPMVYFDDPGDKLKYPIYIRFDCADATGRTESSPWAGPYGDDPNKPQPNSSPKTPTTLTVSATPTGNNVDIFMPLTATFNQTINTTTMPNGFYMANEQGGPGMPLNINYGPNQTSFTAMPMEGRWGLNALYQPTFTNALHSTTNASLSTPMQQFSFATRDGIWTMPVTGDPVFHTTAALETGLGVAVNDRRQAMAFWLATPVAYAEPYVAFYNAASGWLAPVALEGSATSPATNVVTGCMSNNNVATVAWEANGKVAIQQFNNGTPVSAPTTLSLSPPPSLPNLNLSVTCMPNGQGVVLWTDYSGTYTLMARFFSDSGLGAGNLAVSSAQSSALSSVAVAMSFDGRAAVVWDQAISVNHYVYANYYSGGGFLGSVSLLNASNASVLVPTVSMDPMGIATVAWEQPDTGAVQHVYSAQYANGAWQAAQAVCDPGTSVAVVGAKALNGNMMLVWPKSGPYDLAYARYDANQKTWSNGVIGAASTNAMIVNNLSVAVNESGRAIVGWSGNGSTGIFASYFDGIAWTSSSTPYTNNSTFESKFVNIDAAGNATLAWTENASTVYTVYALRVDHALKTWPTSAPGFQVLQTGTVPLSAPALGASRLGEVMGIWTESGNFYLHAQAFQ